MANDQLRLIALDEEDLEVVSSHLQDAVVRVGEMAYGLQCHTELTTKTVGEWGEVPAYACALDDTLGKGALPKLDAEAAAKMPLFAKDSRRLYDNFMNRLKARS